MLSSEEVRVLEAGSDQLGDISTHALVPFKAARLTKARVIWLNRRWFAEKGLPLDEPDTRQRVEQWMLEKFAYAVVDQTQPDSFSREDSCTLFADRYGSNSGYFPHGGSGRAAVFGGFSVKGVGATPLVGSGVNREHSHGCASLNVAIRETIYSEVFDLEFPHGAVPTVALLDAGAVFESSSRPGVFLQRALIVRPSQMRLAHLQRAPGLLDPIDGHCNSQIEDAARTRDYVAEFERRSAAAATETHKFLATLFGNLAAQAAFGQVHRLYSGGYFSSNLAVSAALMDFGNAYALPNWRNGRVLDHDLGFGRELHTLNATSISLDFFFQKYSSASYVKSSRGEVISAAHLRAFSSEILRVWGLKEDQNDSTADRVIEESRSFFRAQQRQVVNYSKGQSSEPWSFSGHAHSQTFRDYVARVCRIAKVIEHADVPSPVGTADLLTARRYLSPRSPLDRSVLQESISAYIAQSLHASSAAYEAFIDSVVNMSRRHWPRLPTDLVSLRHAYAGGVSILDCIDRASRKKVLWIELRGKSRWATLPLRNGVHADVENFILPGDALDSNGVMLEGTRLGLPADWVVHI